MKLPYIVLPAVLLALGTTACNAPADNTSTPAGEAGEESAGAAAERAVEAVAGPRVEIAEPADGDTVTGPSVTVRLVAHGFTVVTAGDTTANSGHHHLFLDRDLSPAGEPIPAEAGHIIHMGDGSESYTFENVEPGEHRLIAVVGDAVHVPLEPWVVDTVRFVVR